ncbi:MAG: hypothetical protein IJ206_09325 [Oscillospiraceae bacterium]|nr:hypothetical protein [Oscillospiraceae bacterium]
MDRLTYYKDGKPYLHKNDGSKNYMRNADIEAVRRLAAYENTGLEPEELDDFARQACNIRMIVGCKTLAECYKLVEDGRLIILPCKVGDTVWERDGAGFLYQYTVTVAYFTNGKVIFDTDGGVCFSAEAIGTSIFFAREEALGGEIDG